MGELVNSNVRFALAAQAVRHALAALELMDRPGPFRKTAFRLFRWSLQTASAGRGASGKPAVKTQHRSLQLGFPSWEWEKGTVWCWGVVFS